MSDCVNQKFCFFYLIIYLSLPSRLDTINFVLLLLNPFLDLANLHFFQPPIVVFKLLIVIFQLHIRFLRFVIVCNVGLDFHVVELTPTLIHFVSQLLVEAGVVNGLVKSVQHFVKFLAVVSPFL